MERLSPMRPASTPTTTGPGRGEFSGKHNSGAKPFEWNRINARAEAHALRPQPLAHTTNHAPEPSNPLGWCMLRAFLPALILFALALPAALAPSQNLSPNDLVRKVVNHELAAADQDHTLWMYRDMTNVPAPPREKTVVETHQGQLTCLEQIDGRPLTADQRNAEQRRIRNFVADASAQRRAQQASRSDDKQSTDLFSILPDAFIFQYDGALGDNVKLTFHPNPGFRSHSMEDYVFHKMDGFVIVNTKEYRLVEIAGALTRGVEFFGGLLGHLDPGGTFDVRLTEVKPGIWKIAKLKVNMHGKVLFFKTIGDQEDETHSDFRQVPDGITLSQAEQLLLKKHSGKRIG